LDPANPYSKYLLDVENSLVEVDDCQVPRLDFVALAKTQGGSVHLAARYVDGAGGAGLDRSRLAATLDEGAVNLVAAADGALTIDAPDLAPGKHRLTIRASDQAGRAAEPLRVPFWIEDQPFSFTDGLLYFAFTDRFRNGEAANDAPVGGVAAAANYA